MDTLEEYKANKKSILDEMDTLKKLLEASKREESQEETTISKKELRRLTDILQDSNISNTEKNKGNS